MSRRSQHEEAAAQEFQLQDVLGGQDQEPAEGAVPRPREGGRCAAEHRARPGQ